MKTPDSKPLLVSKHWTQMAAAAAAALLLAAADVASGAESAPSAPRQTVEHVLPAAFGELAVSPEGWTSAGLKNFTGQAWSKAAYRQAAPARGYGAYVYFEPGARTRWHMHPLGQTLVVVSGTGLTQALEPDGTLGPVTAIRAGDIVRCPPGIPHWHGAAPESSMTHLAISESDPEHPVVWQAPVDESAYQAGAESALKAR